MRGEPKGDESPLAEVKGTTAVQLEKTEILEDVTADKQEESADREIVPVMITEEFVVEEVIDEDDTIEDPGADVQKEIITKADIFIKNGEVRVVVTDEN